MFAEGCEAAPEEGEEVGSSFYTITVASPPVTK